MFRKQSKETRDTIFDNLNLNRTCHLCKESRSSKLLYRSLSKKAEEK